MKTRSPDCLLCRVRRYQSPEQMAQGAQHRMEHRRADRRRDQYRASKERARLRRAHNIAGFLHDLSCTKRHYDARRNCRPIATYYAARRVA